MILSGPVIHLLFETAQGTKRLDTTVSEVVLTLGDVTRVVGDRVGDIVTGHRGNRKDGNGPRTLDIHRFFIATGQL
jgi:hypothetical protein